MRFRGVAPIALIACLAAGCTSDGPAAPSETPATSVTSPDPSTTVPVSTPASSSPTPSVATTGPNVRPGEKPPVLAAIGRTNSPAGALVFVTYWVKTLDWGYATTDSLASRRAYASSCRECERFAAIVDGAAKNNAHFKGGRLTVHSTLVIDTKNRFGSSIAVDVVFDQAAVQEVSSSGRAIGSEPAAKDRKYRTWLKRDRGAWTVVDFLQVVKR